MAVLRISLCVLGLGLFAVATVQQAHALPLTRRAEDPNLEDRLMAAINEMQAEITALKQQIGMSLCVCFTSNSDLIGILGLVEK